MRPWIRLPALALLCTACEDWADDCSLALTCEPCQHPDHSHYDKDGRLDQCHCDDADGSVGTRDPAWCPGFFARADAGDMSDASALVAYNVCDGRCVPVPEADWNGPYLFWLGDGLADCPPQAP